MYYVYFLKSAKYDEIYVGSTGDLKRRLSEHNAGTELSTKRYKPWQLVYYEAYRSEKDAREREMKLKNHGNAMRELKKRIQNSFEHTQKNGAGFTLIEMLVVLSIIGILMGLALTSFMGSRKAARDGKRKADLEQIRSGLEMCRTANVPPGYPATIYNNITCNSQTYMLGTPKDPSTSDNYYYSSTANIYTLCAYLEIPGNGCPGNPSCGSGRTCNFSVANP